MVKTSAISKNVRRKETQDPKNVCNPRVLIISSLPFDESAISRGLYTYFGKFSESDLFQIITTPNSVVPKNVSDYFLLSEKNLLSKAGKEKCGKQEQRGKLASVIKALYKIRQRIKSGETSPLFTLVREAIWSKKRIQRTGVIKWAKSTNPNVLFIHNSDSMFPSKLARIISRELNIPIVLEISDDYYFNSRLSFSPFYYLYRYLYRQNFRKFVKEASKFIFISEKMKLAYERQFQIKGVSVFISAKNYEQMNYRNGGSRLVVYAGNVDQDRWKSIIVFANVLREIDPDYRVMVFSGTKNKKVVGAFDKIQNIEFRGFVQHKYLLTILESASLILITEGFKNKYIRNVRYSLSTKVADSMASGVPIICFAPKDSGVSTFFEAYPSAFLANNEEELKSILIMAVHDENLRLKKVQIAKAMLDGKFSFSYNSLLSYETIKSAVAEHDLEEKER